MGAIIANFAKRIFQPLWHGFLDSLDAVFATIVNLINYVFIFLIDTFVAIVTLIFSLLPELPSPEAAAMDLSVLASANEYLPLVEALALLPGWAAIFSTYSTYKFLKLTRGGG